jgi:hypothetical protein
MKKRKKAMTGIERNRHEHRQTNFSPVLFTSEDLIFIRVGNGKPVPAQDG